MCARVCACVRACMCVCMCVCNMCSQLVQYSMCVPMNIFRYTCTMNIISSFPAPSGRMDGAGGEVGVVSVGSLVIARWRNNSWYPATVTDCKNGR